MATPTVSENPDVQRHYLEQAALAAALTTSLHQVGQAVSPIEEVDDFRGAVYALVEQFSGAAASLSRDYYQHVRSAAGVSGVPRLQLVSSPPRSLVDAGIDYALRARAEADAVEAAIMARVEAAMEKAVLDVGREQVVEAVEGDDAALGFRRVARPDACYWCITLATRRSTRGSKGEKHIGVYKSRASAGQLPPNAKGEVNRYHDNCHCTVEPVFGPDERLPGWLLDMERLYSDATEHSERGESLNDFRRALAARRQGGVTEPVIAPGLIRPTSTGRDQLRALTAQLAALGATPSSAA